MLETHCVSVFIDMITLITFASSHYVASNCLGRALGANGAKGGEVRWPSPFPQTLSALCCCARKWTFHFVTDTWTSCCGRKEMAPLLQVEWLCVCAVFSDTVQCFRDLWILLSVTSRILRYCGLVVSVTLQIWILFGLPFWMLPNGKFNQINHVTNTGLWITGSNVRMVTTCIWGLKLLNIT